MNRPGRDEIKDFVFQVLPKEDIEILKSRSEDIHKMISQVIDEQFDDLVSELNIAPDKAKVIINKLREIPRAMDMEDMEPILDMAFLSIKYNVSYIRGAKVLLRIIRSLSKLLIEKYGPQETFRIVYALERFAMIFMVILSDQMHELYFRAVERATGMSELLFWNYVRLALREVEKEYVP